MEGNRNLSYSTASLCVEVTMRRTMGVGVLLLVVLGMLPASLHGQSRTPSREPGFQLRQNYPNPFNPETYIPFEIGEALFQDGKQPVVTIRIFNVLHQLVAVPLALNHPDGNSVRVERLTYTSPGQHVAYWNGLDRNGRKVGSGLYLMQLEVNGRADVPVRMTVTK
jgi:hypothetical protein